MVIRYTQLKPIRDFAYRYVDFNIWNEVLQTTNADICLDVWWNTSMVLQPDIKFRIRNSIYLEVSYRV